MALSVLYNLLYFPHNPYYNLQLFIAHISPLEGQLQKSRKWACVIHTSVPSTYDNVWHMVGAKYLFR